MHTQIAQRKIPIWNVKTFYLSLKKKSPIFNAFSPIYIHANSKIDGLIRLLK
jgi:CRISPR/Cas system endoribonuclease Cas6 (RAMP superfamily)